VPVNFDAELTRDQAARKLNVTLAVIDAWLARGWLDKDGERRRLTTRKVYRTRFIRFGDLLAADRDTRANRERSHRRIAFDGGDLEEQRRARIYADLARLAS
jgi:hypothetical protein